MSKPCRNDCSSQREGPDRGHSFPQRMEDVVKVSPHKSSSQRVKGLNVDIPVPQRRPPVWLLGSGAHAGQFFPRIGEQSNTCAVCAGDVERRAVLSCGVCGWMECAFTRHRRGTMMGSSGEDQRCCMSACVSDLFASFRLWVFANPRGHGCFVFLILVRTR